MIKPKKNPVTKLIGAGVKAAAKAAGKNVKPSLKAAQKAKPLTTPKSGVKVKPPKKTIGNPPNLARAKSRQIESVARAGGVKGPLGKAKDARVFTSKKPTKKQIDEHYRSLLKQWND